MATGAAAGVRAIMQQVLSFPRRRPVLFGLGFSMVKTSVADLLVQRYVEKRETIDKKRNLSFGLFGLVYLGGVQYVLYNPVFKAMFPYAEKFAEQTLMQKLRDRVGMSTVFKQTFIDQCVHHPLGYFPAFYLTKTLVTGGTVSEAVTSYRANIVDDMLALWKIWVPATLVNFTVSPFWFRIPFVACTSLLWTCILSAMRGASEAAEARSENDLSADLLGKSGESRALGRLFSHHDQENAALIVTSVGDYSPEVIEAVLAAIAANGGNVFDSRIVRLGPSVAMIAIISAHQDHFDALVSAMQHAAQGMHFTARPLNGGHQQPVLGAAAEAAVSITGTLSYCGEDAPGLVQKISSFIIAHGFGLDGLDTDYVPSSRWPTGELHVTARFASGPDANVDLAALQAGVPGLRQAMANGSVKLALARKHGVGQRAHYEHLFADDGAGHQAATSAKVALSSISSSK